MSQLRERPARRLTDTELSESFRVLPSRGLLCSKSAAAAAAGAWPRRPPESPGQAAA